MELSRYQYIVGYGIGQYYDYIKTKISSEIHLDYLCDMKWKQIGREYDGVEVISPDKLRTLENVFVIIFSGNPRNYQSISNMMKTINLPFAHINQIIRLEYSISGKRLKETGKSVYCDSNGNRIEFARDIEDTVEINFQGENNLIKIGKGVSVGRLSIYCGNSSICSIGEGTIIEGATIYATNGEVIIGKDCLFSHQVVIRNHDSHHIFDRNTGRRINGSGNINIGNHVWMGYGATVLGNAAIGDNSIVGTMAVTSSSFPREVVVAGNPARIIRKNVCWSKDNTNFYDRKSLDACLAQEAYQYF